MTTILNFLQSHFAFVVLAIAIAFVLLYKPPAKASDVIGLLERHFGDVLGLYILHLGIFLVILGVFYPQAATAVQRIGESLIMASMIALKLKTVPGAGNGNGGPVEKVTTQTETTRVTVGSPPIGNGL
jgi:hypothetical protein